MVEDQKGLLGDLSLVINVTKNWKEAILGQASPILCAIKFCKGFQDGVIIPNIWWYGEEKDKSLLVMGLQGPTTKTLSISVNSLK